MPTRAELAALEQEVADIQTLMVAALVAHWAENVAPNPAASVESLREFALELVADFGTAAAAVAIDFYESVRPDGAPPFTPRPVVRDDLLSGPTLNWATQPLLTDEFDKALERIAAEAQKDAHAALIETIGEATQEDPIGEVKYARWPQNSNPCAYCVLRASRGAVYWSESTAERGDHLKCGCAVTPIFPGEPLPYQRKPYMAQYQAGAAETTEPGAKALLSAMRQVNGTR